MNTIEYAESAVQNRRNDFTAFYDLGSTYLDAGRLDEALKAFQKAIALNPGTAPAFYKIGSIYHRMGTTRQTIAAFERAIANDPHFFLSYDGLGYFYATKLFEYDRAIETYQRGLAANPGNPYLSAYLGSTYMRMGQMEKALVILEQAIKDHPDHVLTP